MKCKWKRGCRTSQRWISGVLCVEELSTITWMSRSCGTDRLMRFKKTPELVSPLPLGHVGGDLAVADIERGVKVRGAVADVVMGLAGRHARAHWVFCDSGH